MLYRVFASRLNTLECFLSLQKSSYEKHALILLSVGSYLYIYKLNIHEVRLFEYFAYL
jgi:hypothetical protein